jgi:hypothetical protein
MIQIITTVVYTISIILMYLYFSNRERKLSKTLEESYKDKIKSVAEDLKGKFNKTTINDTLRMVALKEKLDDLERDKRLSVNRISILEMQQDDYLKNNLDMLAKKLDRLNVLQVNSIEDKVAILNDVQKAKLYNHYVSVQIGLDAQKKLPSYNEFVSDENIKITDNGKDWKKMGIAQRYTKNFTGIYDWYFKFGNIIEI